MLVNMLSTHIGRCQRMFQYLNSTYIRPYHLHALQKYPHHHHQLHSIPYHQIVHNSSQNVDVSQKIGITAMWSEVWCSLQRILMNSTRLRTTFHLASTANVRQWKGRNLTEKSHFWKSGTKSSMKESKKINYGSIM